MTRIKCQSRSPAVSEDFYWHASLFSREKSEVVIPSTQDILECITILSNAKPHLRSIAGVIAQRTNLSPFTKGCRVSALSMRISEFFSELLAPPSQILLAGIGIGDNSRGSAVRCDDIFEYLRGTPPVDGTAMPSLRKGQ